MTNTTQAHVVVCELYAKSAACTVAAIQLDAQEYPGESMTVQTRRYRKSKALHEKAAAYKKAAELAELTANLKPGDMFTFTIDIDKRGAE